MASSQVEGTVLSHRGIFTFNRALKLSVRSLALILPILPTFLMPRLSCAEIVFANLSSAGRPFAVAVNSNPDPDYNKIYVVNYPGGIIDGKNVDTVTVINGLYNNITEPPVLVGDYPSDIAVNKANNKVYVASKGSGDSGIVTIINGLDNSTETVTVGTTPVAIAVNPEINKIYVVNRGTQIDGTHKVTVIDGADNSTTSVDVGYAPIAVAVNTRTNKVYVANYSGNSVTVIDANDNNSTTPVSVGNGPSAIAVNEVTNKIYVANQVDGTVTVIDGESDAPDPIPLPVGTSPVAVAVNSGTNRVYVANRDSDTVTVIAGAIGSTPATLIVTTSVGEYPVAIVVNPSNNRIYVANQGSGFMFDGYNPGSVSVIDGYNPETAADITVGNFPTAIAVKTDSNYVYVANLDQSEKKVSVIGEAPYGLAVIINSEPGSGNGSINSNPSGISCIKGSSTSCSASYSSGESVTLSAVPEATTSVFSGWSDACTTIPCIVSMDANKIATATFTLAPLVKNRRTGVSYNNLSTAYFEAESGDTIMALSTLTAAGLNLNKPTNLIIEGGYDAVYSTCIGLTPVLGRVNVSLAPLHVHGVAIRSAP